MKRVHLLFTILLCLALFACTSKVLQLTESQFSGSSGGQNFNIEVVATGLGIPWGLAQIDNRTLYVTERHGIFSRIDTETGEQTIITGLPAIYTNGRAGLLDIAIPADYHADNSDKNWLYFSYTKSHDNNAVITLARARLMQDTLIDWQDLLISQATGEKNIHFGGRIAFDNSGHVYMTIGERYQRDQAQDLGNHAGTIIRLDRDGAVPVDNPFTNQPGALPEIWSYGHRNPQGIAYDFVKNRLWAIEHGPYGGDEINLIKKGANYGWPIVSHGKEYSLSHAQIGEGTEKLGMLNPLQVYIPSIAPSSLLLYQGDAFPYWQGNLFSGALKLQHLNRISLNKLGNATAEERLLRVRNERIRDVIESPEGWLYLSTENGKILQITPQENTQ